MIAVDVQKMVAGYRTTVVGRQSCGFAVGCYSTAARIADYVPDIVACLVGDMRCNYHSRYSVRQSFASACCFVGDAFAD